MGQVSRRALLARAGIGTGAGVVALLGDRRDAGARRRERGRSRERAPRVLHQAPDRSTGTRRWLDTPKAAGPQRHASDLVRNIRKQEQAHYGLLAPLLGATAPVDDDFTFTFPAGALRTPATAASFALALEYLATGIAVGAAARTLDVGVAAVAHERRRLRRPAPRRALGARRRARPSRPTSRPASTS